MTADPLPRWVPRGFALLHLAAGIALVVFTVGIVRLAGWGITYRDIVEIVTVAPAWAGPLAAVTFYSALRRGGGDARRSTWLLAAAGVAALLVVIVEVASSDVAWSRPGVYPRVLMGLLVVFLGRLTMGLPLLVALETEREPFAAVGWGLFIGGNVLGGPWLEVLVDLPRFLWPLEWGLLWLGMLTPAGLGIAVGYAGWRRWWVQSQ